MTAPEQLESEAPRPGRRLEKVARAVFEHP
jgi:hypothetical protein